MQNLAIIAVSSRQACDAQRLCTIQWAAAALYYSRALMETTTAHLLDCVVIFGDGHFRVVVPWQSHAALASAFGVSTSYANIGVYIGQLCLY